MNYINLSTLEFPRHEGDIRIEHPEIGDEFVCPDTYAVVNDALVPVFDNFTQKLQYGVPYKNNERWYVDFVVVDLSDEEMITKNKSLLNIETNYRVMKIRERIEANRS